MLFMILFSLLVLGTVIFTTWLVREQEYAPYRAYENKAQLMRVINEQARVLEQVLEMRRMEVADTERRKLGYLLRRMQELEALDKDTPRLYS